MRSTALKINIVFNNEEIAYGYPLANDFKRGLAHTSQAKPCPLASVAQLGLAAAWPPPELLPADLRKPAEGPRSRPVRW